MGRYGSSLLIQFAFNRSYWFNSCTKIDDLCQNEPGDSGDRELGLTGSKLAPEDPWPMLFG